MKFALLLKFGHIWLCSALFHDLGTKVRRRIIQSKQKTPKDIDPDTLNKMYRLGFTYNKTRSSWERKNGHLDPNVKHKNTLARLGIVYNESQNAWTKVSPRETPLDTNITHAGRTLVVSAVQEEDFKAISRLQYIITKTRLESPQNVWDGGLRLTRNVWALPTWIIFQLALWMTWNTYQPVLTDAFSSTHTLHIESHNVVIFALSMLIFTYTSWCAHVMWYGSSGPVSTGAFERSLADAIFSNFTSAPASFSTRESYGSLYTLVSTTLETLASFSRIAMLHGYVQPKLNAFFEAQASTQHILDNFGKSQSLHSISSATFLSVVCIGALATISELFMSNWARPPRTENEEICAIVDSMVTDQTQSRLLDTMENANMPPQTRRVLHERNLKEARAFEKIANAWLESFHNTDIHTAINKYDLLNTKSSTFAFKIAALSGIATLATSTEYAINDSIIGPIYMHLFASCVIFTLSQAQQHTQTTSKKVAYLTPRPGKN